MGYERLKQRLAAGETIILDGPTGTELQRRGAPIEFGCLVRYRRRSAMSAC